MKNSLIKEKKKQKQQPKKTKQNKTKQKQPAKQYVMLVYGAILSYLLKIIFGIVTVVFKVRTS